MMKAAGPADELPACSQVTPIFKRSLNLRISNLNNALKVSELPSTWTIKEADPSKALNQRAFSRKVRERPLTSKAGGRTAKKSTAKGYLDTIKHVVKQTDR